MITVTDATKTAWGTGTADKHIKLNINGTVIENDNIVENSFNFSESIIASDSLEFVGCIAKSVSFKTDAFNSVNLKGKSCSVWVKAGDTEWIQRFTGIIEDSTKEGSQGLKRVTAYDVFYRLSQINACDWWNGLGVTTLFGSFSSFVNEFNISYNPSAISFVNSDITCYGGTKRQAKKLTALDYLKQLCQINGCIGYTDGQGRFGIKYIDAITQNKIYPADSLYPSDFIYPSNTDSGSQTESTTIPYYRQLDYEDYSISQIDKVTIRNTSEDVGIYYPYSGSNNYIIQGNIFAFDQSAVDVLEIAHNIYQVVKDANFRPFSGEQMAFPWVECGDKVTYYDIDDDGNTVPITFVIMSRTMSGGMMLWDNFEAEGEQDQRIFITDLKAQLDDLQNQITDDASGTPEGSLYGMVTVEYTTPIEAPVMGAYESSISGIATEV